MPAFFMSTFVVFAISMKSGNCGHSAAALLFEQHSLQAAAGRSQAFAQWIERNCTEAFRGERPSPHQDWSLRLSVVLVWLFSVALVALCCFWLVSLVNIAEGLASQNPSNSSSGDRRVFRPQPRRCTALFQAKWTATSSKLFIWKFSCPIF